MECIFFDAGYVGAADRKFSGNFTLSPGFLAVQTIAAADDMVFFWRKDLGNMTEKMENVFPLKTVFHNVNRWTFNDIKEADFIAFPVRTNRFIEGNFPGTFFAGAQHHEKFIVNTACRVGGKLGGTAGVEGGDCLDQSDGTDGDQIIRVLITALVFFCNMGYKTKIVLDKNISCLRIAPLEPQKIKLFLCGRQRFQKRFQRFTSKGISLQFMKRTCFSCFSNRIFKKRTEGSSCCTTF